MKLILVMDPENKYRNKLYLGNRLIVTGTQGLEDVKIETRGKKAVATLTVSIFDLIVDSERCPELFHYGDIRRSKGDRQALKALGYTCEELALSPNACDGCPKNPDRHNGLPLVQVVNK